MVWIQIKALYNKTWRCFWILEEIKIYKVKGKKVFNQIAAKAKNVELTKAFIEAFSGVLENSQTSNMKLFVKIVNGIKLLTIFTKSFMLNAWMGSKYTSIFWKYFKRNVQFVQKSDLWTFDGFKTKPLWKLEILQKLLLLKVFFT